MIVKGLYEAVVGEGLKETVVGDGGCGIGRTEGRHGGLGRDS